VETERQAAQLVAFGCKLGQGFLFSKAVHRDEATAMLLRVAFKNHATSRLRSPVKSGGATQQNFRSCELAFDFTPT
jgi:hypothetical protein